MQKLARGVGHEDAVQGLSRGLVDVMPVNGAVRLAFQEKQPPAFVFVVPRMADVAEDRLARATDEGSDWLRPPLERLKKIVSLRQSMSSSSSRTTSLDLTPHVASSIRMA